MNPALSTTSSSKVSIIMAVFNGSDFLAPAIESALAQTHGDFELIIVDDCSTDRSPEIIAHYARDSRVRPVRNGRNQGVAASRNHGLSLATGDWIAFLDQDDIWLPDKLAIQVAALRRHPEAGLMHARYARIDPSGTLLERYRGLTASHFANPDAAIEVRDVFAEIFMSNDIQPLTTMIPRTVLDTVGHFDPELPGVDDYELWLRIALRYPVGHIDTIVGYWRAHPAQQSNRGHRMLTLRLAAPERILSRFPEARRRVPGKQLRNRMHGQYAAAANYSLYHLRDYPAARRLFSHALRYDRQDFSARVKWLYCALPEAVRGPVRTLKNLLSPQRPDNE